jgi:hypothetical protein
MKIRNKIIPVLLASSMIMSQGVFASDFTAENTLEVDSEVMTKWMKGKGASDEEIANTSTVFDVLNGLKSSFIGDDGGFEIKENIYDKEVFTFNMDMDENGFKAVSSLFPNYVIKGTFESVMANASTALTGQAGDIDLSFVSKYIEEYTTAVTNALTMTEPEEGEFEVKDQTYDTVVGFDVDVAVITDAEKKFVNDLCEDENFINLYQASRTFGTPELAELKELNDGLMNAEVLPEFDIKMYMNSVAGNTAFVAKVNDKESGESYAVLTTEQADENAIPVCYLEIPLLKAEAKLEMTMDDSMKAKLDVDIDGEYYGGSFDWKEDGNEIKYFYGDKDNAALTSKTTVSDEANRDAFDEEGKTVLDLAGITPDNFFESLGGIIEDITVNGFANTMNALVEAVPSVGELLQAA